MFGTEDITSAICKTLESIMVLQTNGNRKVITYLANTSFKGEDAKDKDNCYQKITLDSVSKKERTEHYTYFPVLHLICQFECMLQIAQSILRIERVCSISKRVKENNVNL